MELETIGALYRYNYWANERVLEAVSGISQTAFQLVRDGQGSIRDTLTHIVWSEWIWLQRWQGVTNLVFQPADFAQAPSALLFSASDFPTLDSLRERFRSVANESRAFIGSLQSERLLEISEYRTVTGELWRSPFWRQLYHAVNHSTYHRGQVAMMLRQLGSTPLATDFVGYDD